MVWLKTVKFQADTKDLACAKDLNILSMAGRYKQPVQYGRESAHKSRALGNHFSLGVYMYAIQHISKEENETISGA
jgi:hypothetical protein